MGGDLGQNPLGHVERRRPSSPVTRTWPLAADGRDEFALLFEQGVGFADRQVGQRQIVGEEVVLEVRPLVRRQRVDIELARQNRSSTGRISLAFPRRSRSRPMQSRQTTCIDRCGCQATREAERLATQPPANVSRAWAQSSFGPMTAAPSAWTLAISSSHEREHDVDVVDHQVEHDADVGRAAGVRAAARGVDVFGLAQMCGAAASEGRVEPLDVADLQHQAAVRPLRRSDRPASPTFSVIGFSTKTWTPCASRSCATA